MSQTYLSALMARARRRIANPAHAELFSTVLQAHASDFAGITEPRLTHEDLNPSNLLVVPGENEGDDWRISAILDFESAWAGCPESDIARLELWRDMMDDGFYEGYTATQPIAADYPDAPPDLSVALVPRIRPPDRTAPRRHRSRLRRAGYSTGDVRVS